MLGGAVLGLSLFVSPLTAQSISVIGGVVSAEAELAGEEGPSLTFDARTGFALGLSLSAHRFSSTVSFTPEAMYVIKGFQLDVEGDEIGVKFGYLEVPLLLRAEFGQGRARPFIVAGPAVSFKLSCDVTVDLGGIGSAEGGCEPDPEEEEPAEFKSFDVGAIIGGGVQFGRFGVQVRYDHSLTNILDSVEEVTYKNRALMLLGSVAF